MTLHHVHDRLSFGALEDCIHGGDGAVVHACKIPCHRACVGYQNNLPPDHPYYLHYESGRHLYLNLIDPPVPLFKKESFDIFFDFMDRQIAHHRVLIHCNQGQSRAPSLALLYMAKRLDALPDDSYLAARTAFESKFPYAPGKGIETYLTENWNGLGR